jgi:ubiquinone/menaquinone biosynthesis C-methylase UbiE
MQRVLEPEVMDTARDAEEYDAMDFAEPNGRFAEDALSLVRARPGAEILDLGTGTADIPVRMLQRDAHVRIVAVDLAAEMLRLAAKKLETAGVAGRCRLVHVDAKALPLPPRSFDMVMSNSTAHHLPEPLVLFEQIARVVKEGGAVIVRDLVRPASEADAWAIVERAAAGESARQKQLFFDSLHAALTLDEVGELVRRAGLTGVRVARVGDRHWTAERPFSGAPLAGAGAS